MNLRMTSNLAAIVFTVLLLLGIGAALLLPVEPREVLVKCPDGTKAGSLSQCACPSDFECCTDGTFMQKACDGRLECVNNACVARQCDAECCITEGFERKECPSGLAC